MPEPRGIDRRQALRITAVTGVAAALGGGLVADVLRRVGLHRVSETRTQMGTLVTITAVGDDRAAARAMVEAALDEIERLEGILSRHRAGTDLWRLNDQGRLERAAPELVEVLGHAARYSAATEGAFDATVAPLLDLYARRFSAGSAPPEPAEVARALRLVDHGSVELVDGGVRLAVPGMQVTLDGIAKGWIVDRAIDTLVAAGADRVLVNAGGDMASAGRGSRAEPWTVGIEDPDAAGRWAELVRLAGDSIATSGGYMRAFTEDRRFHHIIDPRTGYSPAHAVSVSVVAPSAMEADALSTACLVLGPERALALLESREGCDGVVVANGGSRMETSGMGRRIARA